MKTLVWRRLDEPGMEVAHVRSFSSASGVQIGSSYEVRWQLEGEHLELELNGERRTSFELDGADFFDVFASPFFNSMPVMRDGLLDAGPARDYRDAVRGGARAHRFGIESKVRADGPTDRAVLVRLVRGSDRVRRGRIRGALQRLSRAGLAGRRRTMFMLAP